MTSTTIEVLTEWLQLAEQFHSSREKMFEPQDLPGRHGRHGRVVKLIQANSTETDNIRQHLARVHPDYLANFEQLAQRAKDEATE